MLATPELLEAAAVVALLGGTALWAISFASGAIGAMVTTGRNDASDEDEDDELE